jgi:CheY-like chemotaxis protein
MSLSFRYEVEVAVDGQQGLEALMARSYDFVLCDIDMPILDGLECIHRLRAWEEEHRADKRQTVFCMTGEDKLSDEDIKRAGMSEVMRKPYTMKKVKELKELITGSDHPPVAEVSAEENNALRDEKRGVSHEISRKARIMCKVLTAV